MAGVPAGRGAERARAYERIEAFDEQGKIRRDFIVGQDQVSWIIQGGIMDRTTERLGVGDVGIIMYRRLLEQQMAVVADGGDPMTRTGTQRRTRF